MRKLSLGFDEINWGSKIPFLELEYFDSREALGIFYMGKKIVMSSILGKDFESRKISNFTSLSATQIKQINK
ncbi:hypothetical protein BpHYR1_029078 [Brachionus plicatilis]|uniref:Uncharacterized protein n=1 Tax=Brachionus plicatilis TaxID=10195 RepID=A0A3M7RPG2_BRAPC|nr:hypothetical protein BpHYR1_029078 [Brachionus plicatilis]